MEVLTITSLFPNNKMPDFGNFIFKRMKAFSNQINNVTVIAPVPYLPYFIKNRKWESYKEVKKYEIREGIEVYHPRYPFFPKISMPLHGLFMWLGIQKLAATLCRRKKIDIIDGHFIYPDGLAAVLTAKTLKMPVVLSARGSDINGYKKLKTIKPLIQYALKGSDKIISVCEGLKADMVEMGIKGEMIKVIPNGIDVRKFAVLGREKMRIKLEIPVGAKIILSVGGLIKRKGFDLLITAFSKVIQKDKDLRLYIIGEGPERSSLQKIIDNYRLEKTVRLVGHVPNDDLASWYSAADVFCLTSSREGWANVLMESLACGTPVVATNVYGAPEIVTNSNVGILVERSIESVAKGLVDALGKNWDSRIIRRHVEKRTWNVVANEVEEVFKNVISIKVKQKIKEVKRK